MELKLLRDKSNDENIKKIYCFEYTNKLDVISNYFKSLISSGYSLESFRIVFVYDDAIAIPDVVTTNINEAIDAIGEYSKDVIKDIIVEGKHDGRNFYTTIDINEHIIVFGEKLDIIESRKM